MNRKRDYDVFVIVTIPSNLRDRSSSWSLSSRDGRLPGKWQYLISKSNLAALIERENSGGHEVEVIDPITGEYTSHDPALSWVDGPHKFERVEK
jgi:hypothetical protein